MFLMTVEEHISVSKQKRIGNWKIMVQSAPWESRYLPAQIAYYEIPE
jgi:hypothetical protein